MRKADNPLPQLNNRLIEKAQNITVEKLHKVATCPQLRKPINEQLPAGCSEAHKSIEFMDFIISIEENNNCCLLSDGSIAIVKHIGYKNNEPVIIGKKFCTLNPVENYPCDSRNLSIFVAQHLSRQSY